MLDTILELIYSFTKKYGIQPNTVIIPVSQENAFTALAVEKGVMMPCTSRKDIIFGLGIVFDNKDGEEIRVGFVIK